MDTRSLTVPESPPWNGSALHHVAPNRAGGHRRRPQVARVIARGIGELLITAGAVLLLFVVYQLFYTNIEADRAQAQERAELRDQWEPPPPEAAVSAEPVPDDFSGIWEGDGIAILYIPKLGEDYAKPILEGTDLKYLARGVSHYEGAAMPGQVGNFALAGHRTTNGQPFHNIDRLDPGDMVIVETETNWYRYVIDRSKVVLPTAVEVVAPVPERPGVEPTEAVITFTTCEPKWSSEKRLIVWGHLDSVQPKAAGTPAELQG